MLARSERNCSRGKRTRGSIGARLWRGGSPGEQRPRMSLRRRRGAASRWEEGFGAAEAGGVARTTKARVVEGGGESGGRARATAGGNDARAPAGNLANALHGAGVGETRSRRPRAIRSCPAGEPQGRTAGSEGPRGSELDRRRAARFVDEDSRWRTARELAASREVRDHGEEQGSEGSNPRGGLRHETRPRSFDLPGNR